MTSVRKQRQDNAERLMRKLAEIGPQHDWVDDTHELQRISRALGRIGERQCNENTACPKCHGDGYTFAPSDHTHTDKRIACRACGGSGDTLGKREARLLAKARGIAERYGLRVYHQSDPRGWQVYLIPDTFPQPEDDSHYSQRGFGVAS
jgi:hypothetical protein